jgi:hypothetical protein
MELDRNFKLGGCSEDDPIGENIQMEKFFIENNSQQKIYEMIKQERVKKERE